MSKSIALFIAFFLIFSTSVWSQYQPVYRHLTVDEGLAASEVYHVLQDSKGYIWFATNNGVSRFDGYGFENFDLVSGISDNTVFEIYEDYKHRIWFIPFSGNLSFYENGQIREYPYNSKISQHFPNSSGPIKLSFHVDSSDNVFLGLKQFGLVSISKEGIYKRLEGKNVEGELVFTEHEDGKILTSNFLDAKKHDLIFVGNTQNFCYSFKDIEGKESVPIYSFAQTAKDSSVFISVNGTLAQFRGGKMVRKNSSIASLIIWMSVDDDNNLWVSAFEGGVYQFANCDIAKEPTRVLLNNYQVTSVLRDREGAYWFSTLNDGVFYAPNYNIQTLLKSDGLTDNRVNDVYAASGKVYMGFEMGFMDILTKGKVSHYSIQTKEAKTSYVRSIYGDTVSNRVWVCAFCELGYFSNNRYVPIKTNEAIYPRKIIRSRFGGYWVATAKGLRKVENDRVVYNSQTQDGFSGMVFSVVEDYNGVVWLSTVNGLWKYANKTYQYLGDTHNLLARLSHSMFFSPVDSSLWMGTNGLGIVVYSQQGEVRQISVKDGLISNSIHQVYYNKQSVWVATRQGLSYIPNIGKPDILNYTIDDGLPSNEITSVCLDGTMLYVGTNKGLAITDFSKVERNITPPSTQITRLVVEGRGIPISDSVISLSHSENTFDISYVGLAYRNMGRLLYRHRMVGLDTNWVYSKSTNCLYSGLEAGDYVFELQTANSSGVWGASASKLHFSINPPFWQRLWFIALLALFFAGILYLVYMTRVREIRRRNDLLNNINLYKQQSLRQQMNPHFIFNTLNSIQYYILERDTISSHKYLTKFARLMRMTLDNSESSSIPLRDEIDALRIYLELEALRLEGRFGYSIDYGNNDALLDVKVPTLLIQPFVENAIWHGIMLKPEKSGHVGVSIADVNGQIVCTITDDGVGRDEAKRIRESNARMHKSRGYQITQQRIELLNAMYRDKFSIEVTDLFNELKQPMGTQVRIAIPKLLELCGNG